MQSLSRNWRRCLWFVAQVVGLFAVFYFYVLLRVRPELFYQQDPAVFLFDSAFLAGFVDQPGGLVEYASAFLSPLFAFGWLGALVVTSLAAVICLATRQFVAAIAGTGGWAVWLIPALLILMVLGQYNHPVSLCVGLCAVLGSASAYVRIGQGRSAVRLTAFVIASALAYYAAAGLYVVFAVLCGIFEWRIHRHRWLGAWCALSAVAVPMAAGVWLCDLSIAEAYRGLLLPPARYWLAMPSSALVSQAIRAALLLFFPVAALTVAWRRRPSGSPVVCPGGLPRWRRYAVAWLSGAVGHGSGDPCYVRHGSGDPCYVLRLAAQSAALIVLGVAADVLLFDVSTKYSLLVAYSAERQQWADVRTYARRLPPSDVWNVFQVNRALYHRGELLERMFAYPQVSDAVPTLTLQFESLTATAQRVPLECGDILFDLGRVNESEHMAYEALELFGERPHTLQRLVYLHAIKGEPDAARRFLAVLERSLLHRGWARDCLRRLDADPTLSGLPAVASRRELMVERDFTGKLDLETMLGQLLDRNPRNRMAFEYLMAYYLLTRRIDKMVANLHRLDDFDQARLPRHCEEALVIHLQDTGSQTIDLGGRQISPETRRRSGEFVQAIGRFQGNASAAFTALHHDFGDSYFFFYVFGRNDLQSAQARPSR
jgi:hypothetical protein